MSSLQTTAGSCPVCSSARLYYVFSAGAERVVRCEDCGLLVAHGSGVGPAWRREYLPAADQILPRLASYNSRGGGRLWCPVAISSAWSGLAELQSFELTTGAELHDDDAELFDVIILADLLNSAPDPLALLARAHRALRPNGTLVAWTPMLTAWSERTVTDQIAVSSKPSRHFYFNRETLQSLMFRGSFRRLAVFPFSNGRGGRRPDQGCLVMGQPNPKRSQLLLSVIVAIYNEAATAAAALDQITTKRIPGLELEFIIVESNSTDGTRAIVERYNGRPGVKLVFEDRPSGKGRAVRTGLAHATGDFVLIQDADLEYDLEDYDLLLEPLVAGRAAFVLGARHGGQTWKIRRFNDQPVQAMLLNLAHRGFTALINISCGLNLSDPFTMYKVFRRDCIYGLTFECNRFDFDWEILIKLVRKGYIPIEIPVNYRSRSFKEGKKVRMFRDPLTWLCAWAKARFGPLSTQPTAE